MKKEIKKFSQIMESVDGNTDEQPITFERCREEIARLLLEDGHDVDATAEEIDAFAHQLMKEFNFTFGLLERRIFGWQRNNPR